MRGREGFAEVSKRLFLLENDLGFGFNDKKYGIKEDFSYTD